MSERTHRPNRSLSTQAASSQPRATGATTCWRAPRANGATAPGRIMMPLRSFRADRHAEPVPGYRHHTDLVTPGVAAASPGRVRFGTDMWVEMRTVCRMRALSFSLCVFKCGGSQVDPRYVGTVRSSSARSRVANAPSGEFAPLTRRPTTGRAPLLHPGLSRPSACSRLTCPVA
jgi:hypothetical protein